MLRRLLVVSLINLLLVMIIACSKPIPHNRLQIVVQYQLQLKDPSVECYFQLPYMKDCIEDSKYVWFAGYYPKNQSQLGLFIYDKISKKFMHFHSENSNIPYDDINSLAFASDGSLLIAAHTKLLKFDGVTFSEVKINTILNTISIQKIVVDSKGAIWLKHPVGLCKIEKGKTKDYIFPVGKGIITSDEMYITKDNTLWFTDKGFNQEGASIYSFANGNLKRKMTLSKDIIQNIFVKNNNLVVQDSKGYYLIKKNGKSKYIDVSKKNPNFVKLLDLDVEENSEVYVLKLAPKHSSKNEYSVVKYKDGNETALIKSCDSVPRVITRDGEYTFILERTGEFLWTGKNETNRVSYFDVLLQQDNYYTDVIEPRDDGIVTFEKRNRYEIHKGTETSIVSVAEPIDVLYYDSVTSSFFEKLRKNEEGTINVLDNRFNLKNTLVCNVKSVQDGEYFENEYILKKNLSQKRVLFLTHTLSSYDTTHYYTHDKIISDSLKLILDTSAKRILLLDSWQNDLVVMYPNTTIHIQVASHTEFINASNNKLWFSGYYDGLKKLVVLDGTKITQSLDISHLKASCLYVVDENAVFTMSDEGVLSYYYGELKFQKTIQFGVSWKGSWDINVFEGKDYYVVWISQHRWKKYKIIFKKQPE